MTGQVYAQDFMVNQLLKLMVNQALTLTFSQ